MTDSLLSDGLYGITGVPPSVSMQMGMSVVPSQRHVVVGDGMQVPMTMDDVAPYANASRPGQTQPSQGQNGQHISQESQSGVQSSSPAASSSQQQQSQPSQSQQPQTQPQQGQQQREPPMVGGGIPRPEDVISEMGAVDQLSMLQLEEESLIKQRRQLQELLYKLTIEEISLKQPK